LIGLSSLALRSRALVAPLLRELGLDVPSPAEGTPGDPGLFGPDSVVWRIARERILLATGPSALLMQLAHPLVAAGVSDHSEFRRDPFLRLRATLNATLTISFGDRRQVERATARVRATHNRVRGRLGTRTGPFPAGTLYDARHPDLAMWVHATLVEAALNGYALLVRPLSEPDRARYFEEVKPFAELFGVSASVMPATYGEFRRYLEDMVSGGDLAVGRDARELGGAVLDPPVRLPVRPAAGMTKLIASRLLPAALRRGYGLRWTATERAASSAIAAGVRAAVPVLPSAIRYWPHYRVAIRRTGGATKGA
jgi:uncharacterized protein (DUF2236 family)